MPRYRAVEAVERVAIARFHRRHGIAHYLVRTAEQRLLGRWGLRRRTELVATSPALRLADVAGSGPTGGSASVTTAVRPGCPSPAAQRRPDRRLHRSPHAVSLRPARTLPCVDRRRERAPGRQARRLRMSGSTEVGTSSEVGNWQRTRRGGPPAGMPYGRPSQRGSLALMASAATEPSSPSATTRPQARQLW
jgi:hypothetical protein